MILTIGWQLHHQLVVVGLGLCELVLDAPFVIVSEHLRSQGAPFELLVVSLQVLDDLTILLRTHLGQLNTHEHIHKGLTLSFKLNSYLKDVYVFPDVKYIQGPGVNIYSYFVKCISGQMFIKNIK